jgi:hypothetical protein
MARGRKPVGDRPMTDAERQQRRRDKLKREMPLSGDVLDFRRELWKFVYSKLSIEFSGLAPEDVVKALTGLGDAISFDIFFWEESTHGSNSVFYVEDYLAGVDGLGILNRPQPVPRDTPKPAPSDLYRRVWDEPPLGWPMGIEVGLTAGSAREGATSENPPDPTCALPAAKSHQRPC